MSDIVERLCAVESNEVCETTRTTTNWYRNPDGPEAAEEITRLRAEVERLRELVKDSYNEGFNDGCDVEQGVCAMPLWEETRAGQALQETGDG